jgi:hypothetical protein
MNVTVGETPIFDELRESLGMWDIEELIGHTEDKDAPPLRN